MVAIVLFLKCISLYEQAILSSLNLCDAKQLYKNTILLKNSNQISIYTSAGNIYFAEIFKFQMQEIGISTVPKMSCSRRLIKGIQTAMPMTVDTLNFREASSIDIPDSWKWINDFIQNRKIIIFFNSDTGREYIILKNGNIFVDFYDNSPLEEFYITESRKTSHCNLAEKY